MPTTQDDLRLKSIGRCLPQTRSCVKDIKRRTRMEMTDRTAASTLESRCRFEKKYARRSSARAVLNERCAIETLGLLTGLSETLAKGRDESMCSRSGRITLRQQHHERSGSETCTRRTDTSASLGYSSLLENGTNIMHLEGASCGCNKSCDQGAPESTTINGRASPASHEISFGE